MVASERAAVAVEEKAPGPVVAAAGAADLAAAVVDSAVAAVAAGASEPAAVELACRLTGLSGRAVGMHYGGISASAVSKIRRKVRQREIDILPEVDRLVARIRIAASTTAKSVK